MMRRLIVLLVLALAVVLHGQSPGAPPHVRMERGGPSHDPNAYFTRLRSDPAFVLGYSMRPQSGHPSNLDPDFTNQLSGAGSFSQNVPNYLPTYSPATDTDPEKQDAAKFTIPQFVPLNAMTTAPVAASVANALEYLALNMTGGIGEHQTIRLGNDPEMLLVTNDTRIWDIIGATVNSSGCAPAPCTVLTLATPFVDEVTDQTFASGFWKNVRLAGSTPPIAKANFQITVLDETHVSIKLPAPLTAVGAFTTSDEVSFGQDAAHVRVRRGQMGTAAASHISGLVPSRTVNSLQAQWFPGHPNANTGNSLWHTDDGNTYMWTWDEFNTSPWVNVALTNYKKDRLDESTGSARIEPNITFSGGASGAACKQSATVLGGAQIRMYETPGGTSPWAPMWEGFMGPGVTDQEPLSPIASPYCFRPSVWTRTWVILEQRANDYDALSLWIGDAQHEAVEVYHRLPITVTSPGGLSLFRVEYNTSTDSLSRTDGRSLVFYLRGWAFMKWPIASTPDLWATYIQNQRPS